MWGSALLAWDLVCGPRMSEPWPFSGGLGGASAGPLAAPHADWGGVVSLSAFWPNWELSSPGRRFIWTVHTLGEDYTCGLSARVEHHLAGIVLDKGRFFATHSRGNFLFCTSTGLLARFACVSVCPLFT